MSVPKIELSQPVADRVLIRLDKKPKETEGGIALPDVEPDFEKPMYGTVIAVGRGKYNDAGVHIPVEIDRLQRVAVSLFTGKKIEVEGVDYLVVRYEDILLKMPPSANDPVS